MEPKDETYLTRMACLKDELQKIRISELEITLEDVKDQFCDPENPVEVSFNDISAAGYRVRGGIEYTPCTVSLNSRLSSRVGLN